MLMPSRCATVFIAVLLAAYGASAEDVDCSAWTLDGINAETSETEFLASFGDAPPERYHLSPKKKPRYIHPDYRPELGSELSCFGGAGPLLGPRASTYFDKNGFVRHLIQYDWPLPWSTPLSDARREAEQRRRGKSVPGKGDAVLEKVTECHAEVGALLESRLGLPDEELRSIKVPGSPVRVYRAKSWTNAQCGVQIVFGLFTATTVSADDSECCGEPTIALFPAKGK